MPFGFWSGLKILNDLATNWSFWNTIAIDMFKIIRGRQMSLRTKNVLFTTERLPTLSLDPGIKDLFLGVSKKPKKFTQTLIPKKGQQSNPSNKQPTNRWKSLEVQVYVDITMRAAKENDATTAEQYSRESVRVARTTRELLKKFAGAYHQWLKKTMCSVKDYDILDIMHI